MFPYNCASPYGNPPIIILTLPNDLGNIVQAESQSPVPYNICDKGVQVPSFAPPTLRQAVPFSDAQIGGSKKQLTPDIGRYSVGQVAIPQRPSLSGDQPVLNPSPFLAGGFPKHAGPIVELEETIPDGQLSRPYPSQFDPKRFSSMNKQHSSDFHDLMSGNAQSGTISSKQPEAAEEEPEFKELISRSLSENNDSIPQDLGDRIRMFAAEFDALPEDDKFFLLKIVQFQKQRRDLVNKFIEARNLLEETESYHEV